MTPNPVEGIWKTFRFRMVQKEDHQKVLKLLRDYFYYDALHRIGYTKDGDDEMDAFFQSVLNDGHNLHFLAEDVESGKLAAVRIITLETPGKAVNWDDCPLKDRFGRGLMRFYFKLMGDMNIIERYGPNDFPHLFGIVTDAEFRQMGIATEIYNRAKALLKSRGYSFGVCAFISPYSRAAGKKNGYIEITRGQLLDAVDEDGGCLYPEADPENFMDFGVFEF